MNVNVNVKGERVMVWMSVVTVWANKRENEQKPMSAEWKPKTNNKTIRWKQRSQKYVCMIQVDFVSWKTWKNSKCPLNQSNIL